MSTGIQWTDETWNPTVGCTRVSAGCDHCYAFELHDKRYKANRDAAKAWIAAAAGVEELPVWQVRDTIALARAKGGVLPLPAQYDQPFSRVQLMPDRLEKPLHWKKPRRIFVNSMSDLFHEDVPDEFIDRVFAVMVLAPQHTYQILTKRPGRMRAYMQSGVVKLSILSHMPMDAPERVTTLWPIPNVWLGTSVEGQAALSRLDDLRATPAAIRFVSFEPLLGPLGDIDLRDIDWAIFGGESGPHARPCDVEWIRDGVRQCQAAGVPVFVKQLGSKPAYPMFDGERGGIDEALDVGTPLGWRFEQDGSTWRRDPTGQRIGHMIRLRSRHGSDPEEWPEDLRVREFPEVG